MAVNKITSSDLVNVGVIGLADTPGLSASDMQAKFEETSRSVVIPKVNEIIDNMVDRAYVDQRIIDIGAGDMAKAIYDTNNDGIVDHRALADLATRATSAALSDSCTLSVNSTKWNSYFIRVVTELPESPNANTFYVITE